MHDMTSHLPMLPPPYAMPFSWDVFRKFAFNISCKMETHFTPDICQVLDTYLPNYATLWIAFSLQHHTITSPLTSVQTDRHSFRPPAVCHVVQWILTEKMNLSIERKCFYHKSFWLLKVQMYANIIHLVYVIIHRQFLSLHFIGFLFLLRENKEKEENFSISHNGIIVWYRRSPRSRISLLRFWLYGCCHCSVVPV